MLSSSADNKGEASRQGEPHRRRETLGRAVDLDGANHTHGSLRYRQRHSARGAGFADSMPAGRARLAPGTGAVDAAAMLDAGAGNQGRGRAFSAGRHATGEAFLAFLSCTI